MSRSLATPRLPRSPARRSSPAVTPAASPTRRPAAPPGPSPSTSTATECKVSARQAPSGTITFKVQNTGDEVTEFYLLGEDGLRVVGEVENVGPGLTRDLVVQARPGTTSPACKPGMVGRRDPRRAFTVTDSGATVAPGGRHARTQLEDAEAAVRRLRQGPGRRADRRDAGVRRRVHRGRRRRGPRPVRADPRPLGAHRARRRVVRRPRPPARPPRGRPRRGRGVDRLAPHREGPVAAGGRRERRRTLRAADAAHSATRPPKDLVAYTAGSSSTRSTPRTSRSRRSRSRTAPRSCSTRSRPARSPARRRSGRTPTCGTSRPTSTARRSRSRCCATWPRPRTPRSSTTLDAAVRRPQALLAKHGVDRGRLHVLRRARPGRGPGAGRRRRRPERAAVAADRDVTGAGERMLTPGPDADQPRRPRQQGAASRAAPSSARPPVARRRSASAAWRRSARSTSAR